MMIARIISAAMLLAGTAHAETVAIKAGRLIVDAAKPAHGPSTVIVESDQIITLQPMFKDPGPLQAAMTMRCCAPCASL
jgi:hypothetical protein